MKVLISGAAGVLGKTVTDLLEAEADIDLRLTDVVPLETKHDFRMADLTEQESLKPVCEGIDVLLHIAGIHPWKSYTTEQYIRCNIEGTYSILQAAITGGVRRVIYTSSVAAMGMQGAESVSLPWDETKSPAFTPDDIYSFSKYAGEEACRGFAQHGQFSYVILRPGMFIPVPEGEPDFGLALLKFSVHRTDVAQAQLLALRSNVRNESIVVTAKTAFAREDGPDLLQDAASIILRRYPLAQRLIEQGVTLPTEITCTYDISKAQTLLGFAPRYTFETWLERRFADES